MKPLPSLDLNKVSVAESIGVTAGASTPARIIKEVLDTMSEVKSGETNLEPSFEEMLEESLKNFNTNERVMGTVLSIGSQRSSGRCRQKADRLYSCFRAFQTILTQDPKM